MKDESTYHRDKRKLFEIANAQDGFFTVKQAIEEAHYHKANFRYHVHAGNWVKEGRGLYRLADYPISREIDLIRIWFWTRDRKTDRPKGFFSHETALALWDISDLNPAKTHITVPEGFRRNSKTPNGVVLHLEKRPLLKDKFGILEIATPLQAIGQVVESETQPEEVIESALNDGLRRGIIIRSNFENTPMTNKAKSVIREIWRRYDQKI